MFDKVGMLYGGFSHAWADSDYAMRCRRMGVQIVEMDNIGMTRVHEMRPRLKGMSLSERVRSMRDPKGWNVHDVWLYRRRNWGLWTAVLSSIHMIAYVLWGGRK